MRVEFEWDENKAQIMELVLRKQKQYLMIHLA